ncbi:MAG: RtcB family protein [Chloroflexi bacterium]|nr:MAG: RtcB family protein [Chloroflexota bacterium]
MIRKQDFKRISDVLWEVPKEYRHDMTVPARLYATDKMLEQILNDRSVEQLVNSATLPGLVKYALAMPDIHQGYGFPIGGVVASRTTDGVISPGAIGYDINCGVRLLGTSIDREELGDALADLATAIYENCPSGVGKTGHLRLSNKELDELMVQGAQWALRAGYARPEDLPRTEESGRLEGADPSKVSQKARKRGKDQVGTLGAGNHFIEVDEIVATFDEEAADAMGLFPGQIVVQIHCGSRGFGHQICTDYVRLFQKSLSKYGIQLPDRELVYAPFQSPEGQDYLSAMKCAANYAFANRQVLAHYVRRSFEEALAGKVRNWDVFQVYDIAHNMGKVEQHVVGDETVEVCVHRKGATRAFGPGFEGLPPEYRAVGQPVLVPGSMGTSSWVLVGTQGSMEQSFGSTCHGAGRMMSRTKAKKTVWGADLRDELQSRGIEVRAGSMAGLAEEAPIAYKNVDDVVEVVSRAGIAKKVAQLRPLAVIKG